jgi:hypothetical protein
MDLFRRYFRRYIPTEYVCRYIPTVLPTEYTVRLEIRNGMVTSDDFTDGHYRGIQTKIAVQ